MALAINPNTAKGQAYYNKKKQGITSVAEAVSNSGQSTGASTNRNIDTDDALYRTATDSTDYMKLMNDAADAGDYYGAAQHEQKRNAKIDAMNQLGLNPNNYTKSNQYSAYLEKESVLDRGSANNGSRMDYSAIMDMYQQMQDAQNASIDYNVQKAVADLQRAQEDAQKNFEAQRNQVNIDEAQARDRQVLYAAARGDRGGITARQYDSISNTAANNRQAIAQQQQQLATDTARQIADLRAQGEFQKAEAVLQIAQQQLAQLWELQQYEDSIYLQEQQLAMNESALTGVYKGNKTYEAQQAEKEWNYALQQQEQEWMREIAMSSIQAGMVPKDDILTAAGIDKDYAEQMAAIYKAQLTAKKSTGGGGGNLVKQEPVTTLAFDQMYEAGIKTRAQAYDWLNSHGYYESRDQLNDYADNYMEFYQEQEAAKVAGKMTISTSNNPQYSTDGQLLSITVNGSIIPAEMIDGLIAKGMLAVRRDLSRKQLSYYWLNSN